MDCGLVDKVAKEKLLSWLGDPNLSLKKIYRASEHGFTAADFHKRCDNKEGTLLVIQGTNDMIYGGYSSIAWDNSGQYKADPKGFLFQIRDSSGSKHPWQNMCQDHAKTGIYSTPDTGPSFCCSNAGQYELLLFPSVGVNTSASLYARGGYINTEAGTQKLCGSSNATVQIKDAEVYLLKDKGPNKDDGPWRKTLSAWSEQEYEKIKKEIAGYIPPTGFCVEYANILLLGPVGSGKSSFFNTVNSVYQGYVTAQAPTGSSSDGITSKLRKYVIRNKSDGNILKIRICDTPGFADVHGLDYQDISYLLDGNIPDRFQFNNLAPVTLSSPGFVEKPELRDRMHVVALVLNASDMEKLSDKVSDKIKAVRMQSYARGIPLVVILTHTEEIQEQFSKLADIFTSDDVCNAVQQASSTFGIPKGHIHPVVNYESEVELDMNRDILVLLAMRQMLRFADGYFDDQMDEPTSKPTTTMKKINMNKAETEKGN